MKAQPALASVCRQEVRRKACGTSAAKSYGLNMQREAHAKNFTGRNSAPKPRPSVLLSILKPTTACDRKTEESRLENSRCGGKGHDNEVSCSVLGNEEGGVPNLSPKPMMSVSSS
ncbi:unnamed protein product [Ectocarpus fasciculatus]